MQSQTMLWAGLPRVLRARSSSKCFYSPSRHGVPNNQSGIALVLVFNRDSNKHEHALHCMCNACVAQVELELEWMPILEGA